VNSFTNSLRGGCVQFSKSKSLTSQSRFLINVWQQVSLLPCSSTQAIVCIVSTGINRNRSGQVQDQRGWLMARRFDGDAPSALEIVAGSFRRL
jgi:hypothetical protein